MNSQNAICINVQIHAPYVTLKKYAELTGLSLDKVRKMRASGELPIADKKAERGSVLVNLIAIARQVICPQKSRRLIQGLTTILYRTQSF